MKIKEAKDQSVVKRFGGYRAFIERECFERWGVLPNWIVDKDADTLPLIITYSNYAVQCEDCFECVVIEWDEPFFCPNCLNASNGGLARVVEYPKKKDRNEIERVLLKRINPNSRNMLKGDTIEKLKQENVENGLED